MTHRLAITAFIVLGGLHASAARAAPRVETRRFDVSDLTAELRDDPVLPFGIPPPADHAPDAVFADPAEVPAFTADHVADLVLERLGPNGSAAANGRDAIVVRGQPDRLREIARLLETLGRVRTRSADLSIHWIETEDAFDSPHPDPAAIRALLARAARPGILHHSGSLTAVRGQRAALRRIGATTFVEDYDVEIAQAARIGDIDLGRIREGLEVYVRARPLSDGSRVVIETFARAGRLRRPIRATRTGSDQTGRLDLPAMDLVETATVTVLPPGGVLSLPTSGPTGRAVLLVMRTGPEPRSLPEAADLGFLLARPQEIVFPVSDGRPLVDDPEDFTLRPRFLEATPRGSFETLRRALGTQDPEIDRSRIQLLPFAALVPDPRATRAGRRLAAMVEESAARRLRISLGILADDGATTRSMTLETIPGRWTCGRSGTMRNVLCDPVTEIAKDGAQIEDPLIGQLFDGLTVNARPVLVEGGRVVELTLDLSLTRVDPASLVRIRHPGARVVGGFQQPRTDVARVSGSHRLKWGRPLVLQLGRRLRLRIIVEEV